MTGSRPGRRDATWVGCQWRRHHGDLVQFNARQIRRSKRFALCSRSSPKMVCGAPRELMKPIVRRIPFIPLVPQLANLKARA